MVTLTRKPIIASLTETSAWLFANGVRLDPASHQGNIGYVKPGLFASISLANGSYHGTILVASPYDGNALVLNGVKYIVPNTKAWQTYLPLDVEFVVSDGFLRLVGEGVSGFLFNLKFPIGLTAQDTPGTYTYGQQPGGKLRLQVAANTETVLVIYVDGKYVASGPVAATGRWDKYLPVTTVDLMNGLAPIPAGILSVLVASGKCNLGDAEVR